MMTNDPPNGTWSGDLALAESLERWAANVDLIRTYGWRLDAVGAAIRTDGKHVRLEAVVGAPVRGTRSGQPEAGEEWDLDPFTALLWALSLESKVGKVAVGKCLRCQGRGYWAEWTQDPKVPWGGTWVVKVLPDGRVLGSRIEPCRCGMHGRPSDGVIYESIHTLILRAYWAREFRRPSSKSWDALVATSDILQENGRPFGLALALWLAGKLHQCELVWSARSLLPDILDTARTGVAMWIIDSRWMITDTEDRCNPPTRSFTEAEMRSWYMDYLDIDYIDVSQPGYNTYSDALDAAGSHAIRAWLGANLHLMPVLLPDTRSAILDEWSANWGFAWRIGFDARPFESQSDKGPETDRATTGDTDANRPLP